MQDYCEEKIQEDGIFRIYRCQRRGYKSYLELREEKRFLFFKWESPVMIRDDLFPLLEYIRMHRDWPPAWVKK